MTVSKQVPVTAFDAKSYLHDMDKILRNCLMFGSKNGHRVVNIEPLIFLGQVSNSDLFSRLHGIEDDTRIENNLQYQGVLLYNTFSLQCHELTSSGNDEKAVWNGPSFLAKLNVRSSKSSSTVMTSPSVNSERSVPLISPP